MFRARSLVRALGVAVCLLLAATFSVSVVAALSPVSTVSWTWIGGETGIDNPGNYGTLNQTSADSVPGGRYYSAAWVGSPSLVYLFCGVGYGNPFPSYFNDLWTFNLTSHEWTWIGGSLDINNVGVYGTVGTGSPNSIPGGRYGSAYWQTDEQHFWLFGGYGFDVNGNVGDLNDMWRYDTETGIWTWFSGNDTINADPVYGPKDIYSQIYNPGGRDSAAFWLGADGLFWLFGGERNNGLDYLSDLWSFNPVTFEWAYRGGSQLANQPGNYSAPGVASNSNAPGARGFSHTWTDFEGNLWLFGGYGYGNSTALGQGDLNDLWVYNISQSVWIFIAGNTTIYVPGSYGSLGDFSPTSYPGARDSGVSFVDSFGNLQLFGGEIFNTTNGNYVLLNDLWVFNIKIGQWAWINGSSAVDSLAVYGVLNETGSSVVPGGREGPALWNTSGTDPVMFGGFGYSNTSGPG